MLSSFVLRRLGLAVMVAAALGFTAIPGQAQMREQMAEKIAVKAANSFVTKINGQSCSDFASTMSQMKHSSGSSSSSMSSKLKANSQARSQFVNIVAGPLLNKMIDCNMMPGGM
jgi:hypothetical protein